MIFRLIVDVPQRGWVLVSPVEAADPLPAFLHARQYLKPQYEGMPLLLLREGEPLPGKQQDLVIDKQ
jgi:hypothetical protein